MKGWWYRVPCLGRANRKAPAFREKVTSVIMPLCTVDYRLDFKAVYKKIKAKVEETNVTTALSPGKVGSGRSLVQDPQEWDQPVIPDPSCRARSCEELLSQEEVSALALQPKLCSSYLTFVFLSYRRT